MRGRGCQQSRVAPADVKPLGLQGGKQLLPLAANSESKQQNAEEWGEENSRICGLQMMGVGGHRSVLP